MITPVIFNFCNNAFSAGIIEECRVLPIIRKYFKNNNIRRVLSRYSKFDFTDGVDTHYELKSNFKKIKEFSTSIISTDKLIDYHNKKLVLLFTYSTCNKDKRRLFFIEYDKNTFEKFKTRKIFLHSRNQVNKIVLIPVTSLTEIIDG